MNMFKPVKAKTREEYFDMLVPERREQIETLDKFIQKAVPKLKTNFLYNMLGYGTFQYKNNKKQLLEWPVISLASQKNYISIYVCAIENGKYLAEQHAAELGKVSVGKSCIRLKKIEDVNLKTLEKVLKLAAKKPGLSTLQKNTP